MRSDVNISAEHFDTLAEQYLPYIVRTASDVTGRYISPEHDECFVVALSAFSEAVERYDSSRGNFLSFARLVIRSRLLTYLQEENSSASVLSLEELAEKGYEPEAPGPEENELRDEILLYQLELRKFGLSLSAMVQHSPCHRNTRETAVLVAEQASRDDGIVSDTYRRRKLPIRPVARLCQVSEKIVKTSKHFILGTMLLFVLKLPGLTSWVRETR